MGTESYEGEPLQSLSIELLLFMMLIYVKTLITFINIDSSIE